MRNLICSLALLLTLLTGAKAQSSSPAHLKAAEDLIAAMDMQQVFDQSLEAIVQAQMGSDPMLKPFEDIMRDFMKKYLKWDEMKSDYAKIYMEVFTEAELRQITELYQTPLGKKMLKTLPDLFRRGAQLANDRLQAHLPELQEQILDRLKQQEKHKHEKQQPHPQD